MKKYIITQEEREEILASINKKNFVAAKNALNQLPELKEES